MGVSSSNVNEWSAVMLVNLALVLAGIVIALIFSVKLGYRTAVENHAKEWSENKNFAELTDPIFRWTVVHIRDDIGSIYNTVLITNGLLGGILATLIVQLIR
jgi:hypothetical protein